ncbi:MAG: glycine cleavage system aminomethyltransferase GcvT [Usitatibacter sp.]
MERRTPLFDFHARTANKMVKGGGDFMFPFEYTSNREEHVNTRTQVGMQDLSTMGEVDVKGPDAERLINQLTVNEVGDLVPGQVRYSTMCNGNGGIIDDVTVYKLSSEHFMVVTSSGPRKKTAKWIAEKARELRAYVTDVTGAIALPVIQGPRSREFLASVVSGLDLSGLKYFRFGFGLINETEVLISRSGYTGELGYELYVPAEEAAVLWEYLLNAGSAFGLKPYGVLTMNTLRIEKAYPLYGNDINEDYTPFHAGLDRWIKFEKKDFIGRDALLKLREQPVERRWTGLVLEGDEPATVNGKVFAAAEGSSAARESPAAGEEIGQVTCSNRGHSVGKTLAMAYVDSAHAELGRRVRVQGSKGIVSAVVARTPFFDPDGARSRV